VVTESGGIDANALNNLLKEYFRKSDGESLL